MPLREEGAHDMTWPIRCPGTQQKGSWNHSACWHSTMATAPRGVQHWQNTESGSSVSVVYQWFSAVSCDFCVSIRRSKLTSFYLAILSLKFYYYYYFFKFYFIFKLYIIVLVLPNIKMNLPQVYMCSPSCL